MGKRSSFTRIPKDLYITTLEGVLPLIPHLAPDVTYIAPCCGTGAIKGFIQDLLPGSKCMESYDLYPVVGKYVSKADARTHQYPSYGDCFIENPTWQRMERGDKRNKDGNRMLKPSHEQPLHMIIDNLAGQKPTWLLFDCDWMQNKQARPYLKYCVKIVSIGRLKWIPGTKDVGKDNCQWYLFDKNYTGSTEFIGRT